MDKKELKEIILETLIESTEAQLRAFCRLRAKEVAPRPPRKRRSNISLVEDVLRLAATPLHIVEILRRVEQIHGVRLDRESLVSQITKQVLGRRRFVRPAPNTFALLTDPEDV